MNQININNYLTEYDFHYFEDIPKEHRDPISRCVVEPNRTTGIIFFKEPFEFNGELCSVVFFANAPFGGLITASHPLDFLKIHMNKNYYEIIK